ncbi:MAG: RimK/LysX family protein [Verrucomicrobiales bacterium]
MNRVGTTLRTVGWREWLSIPDLGIPHIKAKVDTGARTSALHTGGLEEYTDEHGDERVRFTVHPIQGNDDYHVECDCVVASRRSVKDSGGHEEVRPFIRVPVTLGTTTWEINFSLTNRDNMKFRMLLGRTAMVGRFKVDPALSYNLSSPPESDVPGR